MKKQAILILVLTCGILSSDAQDNAGITNKLVFTSLSMPEGGAINWASAINNAGEIAGGYFGPAANGGAIWNSDGAVSEKLENDAWDINDSGTILPRDYIHPETGRSIWDSETGDSSSGASTSVWISGINNANRIFAYVSKNTWQYDDKGISCADDGNLIDSVLTSEAYLGWSAGGLIPTFIPPFTYRTQSTHTAFCAVRVDEFGVEHEYTSGTDTFSGEEVSFGAYSMDDAGYIAAKLREELVVSSPQGGTLIRPVGAVGGFGLFSDGGLLPGQSGGNAAIWPSRGTGTAVLLPKLPGWENFPHYAWAANDEGLVIGWAGENIEERRFEVGKPVLWNLQKDGTYGVVDLSAAAPDGWSDLTVSALNNAGQVVGNARINGVWTGVLITLPKDNLLAMDLNRDGETLFNDDPRIRTNPKLSDETSEAKPFRFWLNDDNDSSGIEQKGGRDHTDRDHADSAIGHIRDLEDFLRLAIRIQPDWKAKFAQGYKLVLETSGTGKIKAHVMIQMEGETDYLTDLSTAQAQVEDTQDTSKPPVNLKKLEKVLEDRHFENGKLFLLIEGVKAGSVELKLRLLKPGRNGQEELSDTAYLHLHPAREFFTHARAVSLDRFQAPYRIDDGQNPAVTLETVHEQVVPVPPDESGHCIVWIHGWRMQAWERQNWAEMMYKRLWHAGYKGRFAAFSWFTLSADEFGVSKGLLTYNDSEYRAWKSAPALREFVARTRQNLPSDYSLNLVAHSMGNVVTGEAIRLGTPFDRYVMMQAAMSASAYDPNPALRDPVFVTANSTYPTPVRFDELGYEDYFRNLPTERIINFYNEEDYALRTGRESLGSAELNTSWTGNNLDYKPQPIRDRQSYRFLSLTPSGLSIPGIFRLHYDRRNNLDTWRLLRQLTDPHESMAYLVRSLTHAVGAESRTRGVLSEDGVNLNAIFGFDDDRAEHSAQFNRPIQNGLIPFYSELLDNLEALE